MKMIVMLSLALMPVVHASETEKTYKVKTVSESPERGQVEVKESDLRAACRQLPSDLFDELREGATAEVTPVTGTNLYMVKSPRFMGRLFDGVDIQDVLLHFFEPQICQFLGFDDGVKYSQKLKKLPKNSEEKEAVHLESRSGEFKNISEFQTYCESLVERRLGKCEEERYYFESVTCLNK